MKKFLLLLAMLGVGAVAQASTSFTFTENVSGGYVCTYGTQTPPVDYCVGYDTSLSPHTIGQVTVVAGTGLDKTITIVVDGVSYTGLTTAQGGVFTLTASGQPNITGDVNWIAKRTGHIGHFVTHFFVTNGGITLP